MIPDSTILATNCPRDAKRQAFVDAAREAFFTHGYAATAMSTISARVGGSKTTLWSYFPAKQDLFVAVIDDLIERYGRAFDVAMPLGEPVWDNLRRFGLALMETLHSQPIIDLHRLVTGEVRRFPELAQIFHERGPARGKARLAAFIADAMAAGQLRPGDPRAAARMFAGACQVGSCQLHMLGVAGRPDTAELEAELELVLDAFQRAWAP